MTAKANRSKADKDPAEWMPPSPEAQCRYVSEWVGDKLRWGLTVDPTEKGALVDLAEQCQDTAVTYEPAP